MTKEERIKLLEEQIKHLYESADYNEGDILYSKDLDTMYYIIWIDYTEEGIIYHCEYYNIEDAQWAEEAGYYVGYTDGDCAFPHDVQVVNREWAKKLIANSATNNWFI